MSDLLVEVYKSTDCSCCVYAALPSDPRCVTCFDACNTITRVNEDVPFSFKEVDIRSNDDLYRRYKDDIPTIFINGKKAFKFKVDEDEFRKRVRKELIKSSIMRMWDKKTHNS
jgi:hypothetical protein